ncbi:MAG TPA: hypothetical protein VFE52_10665, partial [Devosia sp.]|nr:hypothetical protein [Devosia sp.]
RTLIERARELWILADHSKFGQFRPAVITELAAVDCIITDTGISPDMVAALQSTGPRVIQA